MAKKLTVQEDETLVLIVESAQLEPDQRQTLAVALDFIEGRANPGETFSLTVADLRIYEALGLALYQETQVDPSLVSFPALDTEERQD